MIPETLTYYPDDRPGITRRKAGRGFSYRSPDGTRMEQTAERHRIEALAVPPAYTDVWISPERRGHLQVTGRDAAARKFDDLPRFGATLSRLRGAIEDGLKEDPGTRLFSIATVLGLIDRLFLRPGHPDYTQGNGSYGAATLRSKHLLISDEGTKLRFRAKVGVEVVEMLTDKRSPGRCSDWTTYQAHRWRHGWREMYESIARMDIVR